MACNLLGGWCQRVEKIRKYGFASLVVFGDEPNLTIQGCWLFRGQEIPQEMKECDDYEQYVWRKADLNSDAEKSLISNFWTWSGDFGGKKFAQGKIFK